MELRCPHGQGQFWGLSSPLKAVGVSAAVYAAKGSIQFSITAWQSDCRNSVSHHIVPREKSAPLRCGLLLKSLTTCFCLWFWILAVRQLVSTRYWFLAVWHGITIARETVCTFVRLSRGSRIRSYTPPPVLRKKSTVESARDQLSPWLRHHITLIRRADDFTRQSSLRTLTDTAV